MPDEQIPSQAIPVLRATIPVDLDLSSAEKKLDAFEDRLNAIEDRIRDLGTAEAIQPKTEQSDSRKVLLSSNGDLGLTKYLDRGEPVHGVADAQPFSTNRIRELNDLLKQEDQKQILQVLVAIDQKLEQMLIRQLDS